MKYPLFEAFLFPGSLRTHPAKSASGRIPNRGLKFGVHFVPTLRRQTTLKRIAFPCAMKHRQYPRLAIRSFKHQALRRAAAQGEQYLSACSEVFDTITVPLPGHTRT
jgi:hypothetical protein